MNKRYGLRKLGAIGVVHARLADNRSKFKAAPADVAFCLQRIAYSVSTPINRERIGRSFSTLMRIALFQILIRLRLAIFPNPNHRTFNANSVCAIIETFFFMSAAPTHDFNVQSCMWQKIVFLILHFFARFIRIITTLRASSGESEPVPWIHIRFDSKIIVCTGDSNQVF